MHRIRTNILLGITLSFACASFVAAEPARRPVDFGSPPSGASYAFVRDIRPDVPVIMQPEGVQLTPVLVQPIVPERYPEELIDEAILESPDPRPAGVAWDGTSLWVAGRETNRIYRVDPTSGEVQESFAAPGRFPTCTRTRRKGCPLRAWSA